MALLLHRRDHIDRIDRRIGRLRDRAAKLLEREQQARSRADELEAAAQQPVGRIRRSRRSRRLRRRQVRAERLRARREQLVQDEIREVLLALQDQSQRTRLRLDQELSRLEPVQAEWERIREVFDSLEAAVATPAVEQPASQWAGQFQIPDFPVREQDGYPRPFPQRAMVF
jgi:hypothetical protein